MTSSEFWFNVSLGLVALCLGWLALHRHSVGLLPLWHGTRWVTGVIRGVGTTASEHAIAAYDGYQRPWREYGGRMNLVHEETDSNRVVFVASGEAACYIDLEHAFLLLACERRWASDDVLHIRRTANQGATVTIVLDDRAGQVSGCIQPLAVIAGDRSTARASLLEETFWLLLPLVIGALAAICAEYIDWRLWGIEGLPPCP